MISRVNFGSSYHVSTKQNSIKKFNEFKTYAYNMSQRFKGDISASSTDSFGKNEEYGYSGDCTLNIPSCLDKSIEAFCKVSGIKFTKNGKISLTQDNIVSKILLPQENSRIVYVNPLKLEKILAKQYSYIPYSEQLYVGDIKQNVEKMINSGKKFPTTTLSISPINVGAETVVNKIKQNGINALFDKFLSVDFVKNSKNQYDQFVYFALRNMGMKKIPVYADDNTYKLGSVIGIFEED